MCHTASQDSKTGFNEIFYGDFDRATGLFKRTSSYDLGPDTAEFVEDITVAPDNSRIYCLILPNWYKMAILEIPIVEGIPQWDRLSTIIEKDNFYAICQFFHALDRKVYALEGGNGCTSSLDIDENGKTVYTVALQRNAQNYHGTQTNPFVASWYSDLPCTASPTDICPMMSTPEIQFANATICNGEDIEVDIPEGCGYSFSYSKDGGETKNAGFTSYPTYTIPASPGRYRIESITYGGCTFAPTDGNTATVLPRPNTPSIVPDER